MMMNMKCVGVYLCKSLSGLIFRDKSLGDVLLEWWEKKPEKWDVLPEQASSSNAAWVKGSKCNSGILVISTVELLHGKHVADFAVFVCLGTIKITSIYH